MNSHSVRIFFALLPLLLSSCGMTFNSDASDERGNIKVMILKNKDIPLNSAEESNSGTYNFQVIELLNIYHLASLSGKYVQFYTNANNKEGVLKGTPPRGHFLKNKNGIYIPKDNFTMELSGIYYHTQNLALIDAKLGLTEINPLPRKIVIGTKITNSAYQDNNAIYDGAMDAIIYLPYKESQLTLALNAGVFAHEYFHSIFYKLVQKNVDKNSLFADDSSKLSVAKSHGFKSFNSSISAGSFLKQDLAKDLNRDLNNKISFVFGKLTRQNIHDYYTFLLKGLNEGLADFWGWSYTQDVNFVNHSISEGKNSRKLDLQSQKLKFPVLFSKDDLLQTVLQDFKNDNEKEDHINYLSYQVGTRFALFFKELTATISKERGLSFDESKFLVMKSLIDYLRSFGTDLITMDFITDSTKLISPNQIILKFSKNIKLKNQRECELFLNSFQYGIKTPTDLACQNDNDGFVPASPTENKPNGN